MLSWIGWKMGTVDRYIGLVGGGLCRILHSQHGVKHGIPTFPLCFSEVFGRFFWTDEIARVETFTAIRGSIARGSIANAGNRRLIVTRIAVLCDDEGRVIV